MPTVRRITGKEMAAGEYLERFNDMAESRKRWEGLWENTTKLVLPRRSVWDFDPNSKAGDNLAEDIFDGTAPVDLQLMADGFQGYVAGPAIRWFKLQLTSEEQMEIPGVRDWLEVDERIMYAIFQRSKFYESVAELFTDGGCIGNAHMGTEVDLDSRTVLFNTRHPKEMYIAEGKGGKIILRARRFFLTGYAALDEYNEDDLPQSLREDMEKRPQEHYEFVHFIHKRDVKVIDSPLNIHMPYASVHLAVADQAIVRESGFNSDPELTWRWQKNSDEEYGRGPGTNAISIIKRVNQMAKAQTAMGQRAAQPPWMATENLKGKVNLKPNGITWFQNAQQRLEALRVGDKWPIGDAVLEETRDTIDDFFYTDFFVMLKRAEREMTAREVIERQGEKAAILGSVIGRLTSEFLRPLVDRVFQIASDAGWLPPPPPALLRQPSKIDVEFIGPLAAAQKRFTDTQGVNAAIGAIGGLTQIVGPQVLDNFDMDALAKLTATLEGLPQKVIREKPEIDQIRQARAQAQQAQQQAELLKTAAGAVPDLSQAPEEGSIINELQKQNQGAVPVPGR